MDAASHAQDFLFKWLEVGRNVHKTPWLASFLTINRVYNEYIVNFIK